CPRLSGCCVPALLVVARRRALPGGAADPRRQGSGGAVDVGRGDRPVAGVRVAYYSPLPPSRSGIPGYSALLLPGLERLVGVRVGRPGRLRRPPQADVALYHIGNDPEAHGWIVEALRRRPGIVVLHDFVLHHLVAGLTLGRGDWKGYLDALE